MSKEKRRVPKLRFPGFTEDWEQRKLESFLIEYTEKNPGNEDLPVLTSSRQGLTKQEDHFGSVQRHDISDYNVIPLGFCTYRNRSDDKTFTFNINRIVSRGLVSKFYPVFDINNGNADFITAYLNNNIGIIKSLAVNAVGTSQVVLSLRTLRNIEVTLPSKMEQVAIGNCIRKLDIYITLHQRKLNNLKLKKKALLQKLFPKNGERYPELRFPGFTDAWEQRKFKDIAFKRGKISEADLPYIEFEDINSGIGTLNKNILQKVGHKKGILFEAGDVLFGKLRPYLQNWLLCQFAGIAVGDFWVLQPQNVSSAFLYYLIQSEAYQSVANISSGTKMPRSSWPLVSETLFSIPKYKEANMIGEFFLLIDRTITLHQRKLDHLKLQKKALLQQMFV